MYDCTATAFSLAVVPAELTNVQLVASGLVITVPPAPTASQTPLAE